MRETALLIPEAAPVSSSATDVMTAVDSGDTTRLMPTPINVIAGNTASQKSRNPLPTAMASAANETATTMLPPAIGSRGPIRSESLPTGPDMTAIASDSGTKMRPASASPRPQAAISSIGR